MMVLILSAAPCTAAVFSLPLRSSLQQRRQRSWSSGLWLALQDASANNLSIYLLPLFSTAFHGGVTKNVPKAFLFFWLHTYVYIIIKASLNVR